MKQPTRKAFASLGALCAVAWSPSLMAEEEGPPPPIVRLVSEAPKPNPLGVKPIAPSALSSTRGGTEVLNTMKLKGVVADNQAVNVATGSNAISDGALAGTAGLPMVIQNTGNNVLIQNATIVNVQMK